MFRPRLLIALLATSCALALHAQDAAPADAKPAASTESKPTAAAPDARQTLIQMIQWDKKAMGAVTPENPHGLKWEFTPTGNISDTSRGQEVAMTGIVYHAPINNQWNVIVWQLDKPGPAMQYRNVWANRQGVLWRNRPPGEAQDAMGGEGSIGFKFGGAKGEAYRYMLLSDDKKTAIYGVAVPFPIEQKQGKCHVELRLGSKDGRSLIMLGQGFPATSQVHMNVSTAGKDTQQDITTDAKGMFVTGLLPPVTDQESGKRELTFSSPSGGCTLHFSQPWGKGSYERQ